MKPITQRETIREVLELSNNPTLQEVKSNYKRLMKKYHPDINKSPEAVEYAKKLNLAYEMVMKKASLPPPPPPPTSQRIVVIIRYGGSWGSSTYTGSY